jgi:hypothetical protein
MMARKPPPKGRKHHEDEAGPSGRRAVPPPAGLPVMPRPYEVDDIRPDGGTHVEITASDAECVALAKSYDLPGMASLSGRFDLRRHGKTVFVRGSIAAHVTQICVVTLEPFDSDVVGDVEMQYAPAAQVAEAWERIAKAEASGSNAPVEDPPDAIVDGRIDLGALTAETLALALDPYPKKPGVEFASPQDPDETPDESPFAVLAARRSQEGPDGAR